MRFLLSPICWLLGHKWPPPEAAEPGSMVNNSYVLTGAAPGGYRGIRYLPCSRCNLHGSYHPESRFTKKVR